MKMDNEIVSLQFISTTREQALLENDLFPLINFEHQINYNDQQLILVNQDSGFRQVLAILRGDLIIDSGSIKVEGNELSHLSVAERSKMLHDVIGFIDFENRLIPYLTMLENLYAGFWNLPSNLHNYRTHIQALLNWFHLDAVQHCFPKECSPQQRSDLLLLRAFVHQPKLVAAYLPLDVSILSIRQLIQLAKTTQTSLLVFMQMDSMNERQSLITNHMLRGIIMSKGVYSHEFVD